MEILTYSIKFKTLNSGIEMNILSEFQPMGATFHNLLYVHLDNVYPMTTSGLRPLERNPRGERARRSSM